MIFLYNTLPLGNYVHVLYITISRKQCFVCNFHLRTMSGTWCIRGSVNSKCYNKKDDVWRVNFHENNFWINWTYFGLAYFGLAQGLIFTNRKKMDALKKKSILHFNCTPKFFLMQSKNNSYSYKYFQFGEFGVCFLDFIKKKSLIETKYVKIYIYVRHIYNMWHGHGNLYFFVVAPMKAPSETSR